MTSLRSPRFYILALVSVIFGLGSAASCFSAQSLDNLVITEFMAENNNSLADEDGDFPDWVEIYNAGTNTVNLNGWYLTDRPDNPGTWWRFPATNLTINSYLIVFASGKQRATPGMPLHTDFKLNDTGDYIALVKPDGVTIQSSFQTYPLQVPNISYGVPVTLTSSILVSNGSPAKFTVPLNDSLGLAWTEIGFSDASWASVVNGVGYESEEPATGTPVQIADSVADFGGVQGGNSWYYGYWDKKADADHIYKADEFIAFPRGTGTVLNSTNYFSTKWDWPSGDPPFTEISNNSMHPSADNGVAALATHWAIRRYVAETNGPLRISGVLAASSTNGTCGDGTIAHIIVDGVDVWQRAAFYSTESYSIVVNANLGSTIDFAVEAGPNNNDACDATFFTAFIRTAGPNVVIADSIADWSGSGVQGENNWTYGYYNRTVSGVTYSAANFRPFPSGSGPHSTANFWNGSAWQWFDGDPPFDTIGETLTRPSVLETGGFNGQEHWVIRRWVSQVTGVIVVDWHVAKKRFGGTGVTAALFQNGTQRDSATILGADFAGPLKTTTLTVQAGDFIDFSVAPGADVDDDICSFNATIHGTTTLAGRFVTDVGNLMTNINSSAYLRIPFTVTDPGTINGLLLRLRYDDGFAAYLNGVPVASDNAVLSNQWNSAATQSRPDTEGVQYRTFDLNDVRDVLVVGNNVLAIQGLNASATDPDFLLSAELTITRANLNMAGQRYFSGPTPGTVNGIGTANLGPLVTKIKHAPREPADNEDLVVTAQIAPTINPIGTVRLYYRIMYGSESNVVMRDDGLHGDGLAGDGVYGAAVPNSIFTAGQMVRYYFTATDSLNNLTRQPPLGDTNNSSIYFGTVVRDPSLTNPLPVLHWFVAPGQSSLLDSGSGAVRCALYWKGELYDNLKFTRHGQSSTGFRKKSYNIDFNPDHHFLWADGERRIDDINLLNTYPDKAHMRNILGYETHRDAGYRSPHHFVVPVRMQSNAVFYGTAHIVENGDDNYLRRIGRDPNGSLYKMYDTMSSTGTSEKKTRRFEDKSDLQELITRSTNRPWIYDNVDISEVIDFLAAMIVTGNVDCCHKNYYVYRDTEGDKEWEMLPWDVDLSFGRNWSSSQTYWDDTVYPNNGLTVGGNAVLPATLFAGGSATRQMYMRRVRTLMDTLQQTNGTPAAQLKYEKRIDELAAILAPDAALDLVKWGSWGGGAQDIFTTTSPYYRTLPQSVAELKTNYMPRRRAWVFDQKMGNVNEFPNAQPTNVNILIGAIDYNPASRNQEQEYIQLMNTNNFAVDISGWKLSGGVTHTFQGGVVLASTSSVYVAANKLAFRARTTGPRGGQQLFVEGPYEGRLSARGETIVLADTVGRVVSTNRYLGNPSGPQQYLRITELMYHPPRPAAGSLYGSDDLEYIELRNIGPTNLPLAGVHFSNGIDFTFPATSLAPGNYVLVVRNTAAFVARYGNGLNIAGQYAGGLDNGGETIRLDDAVGEKILEFKYNNSWYPVTDGPGASLVIRDDTADWRSWDLKESWRPSAVDSGSPGQTDGTLATVLPVVISEVLTHTDPPLVDAIELFNPNLTSVDISGWFLSDDFAGPKKFVIPVNTVIPAGGYLIFYETNSFGLGSGSFQLSSQGDEAFLFSGNGTQLTGYLDGWEFGASDSGISFGRYINSQTNVHFVAQSARSLGSANGLPKVGPVVLSEINYRPVETLPGVENQVDEYVELANITASPVPLFDPGQAANTWRLRGGIDFDFPANLTLQPGQHIVVVSFHPLGEPALLESFRTRFSIPPNTLVVGPFSGQLANEGESIRLSKPGEPATNSVPYILVDQVDYSNLTPWNQAADGIGLTLQRLVESAYGNDPTNWTAVAPSGGLPYTVGGVPPTFIRPPSNISGLLGQSAELDVEVAGSAPFFYLWRHNGQLDPRGNGPKLTIPNIQISDGGTYTVLVYNSAGSLSANATFTVLLPISIAVQPQPISLRGSTNQLDFGFTTNNAVFNVVGNVQRPTTYQWRKNGLPILGATTASLTVPNVGLTEEGVYDVVLTDALSQATSAPARLAVLVPPVFLVAPVNQAVPSNGTFSASAVVRGNPALYKFEWREISTFRRGTTNSTDSTNVMSYGPVTNFASRSWRLLVMNDANPSGSVATFAVAAVPDTDGDGLPDDWETTYGFNPASDSDRNVDSDGDTMSNYQEFLAGTDPTQRQSFLKIETANAPGGVGAAIQFGAVANKTYNIWYTDNLGRLPWTKLLSVPARSNDRVETIIDPTWTTNRFYQIGTPAR